MEGFLFPPDQVPYCCRPLSSLRTRLLYQSSASMNPNSYHFLGTISETFFFSPGRLSFTSRWARDPNPWRSSSSRSAFIPEATHQERHVSRFACASLPPSPGFCRCIEEEVGFSQCDGEARRGCSVSMAGDAISSYPPHPSHLSRIFKIFSYREDDCHVPVSSSSIDSTKGGHWVKCCMRIIIR